MRESHGRSSARHRDSEDEEEEEELSFDLRQHLRECRCPCDHLGYGNYLQLQVREKLQ